MKNIQIIKYDDLREIMRLDHHNNPNGVVVDDAALEVMLRIEKIMQRLEPTGDDEQRALWIEIKAPSRRNRTERADSKGNYWYQLITACYEDIHFFIKDFSIENIYGIKTIFSVGDDSTREYCEFAEWLQSFINTRRWEQNEEVSYTKFNDIIKEAAHECLETQEYLYIVDQTIGKMNKQLSNLNFSKIGFIQFRTRPSGNEVFGMLQKFKEFYMTYKEIIENKSPGVFAPDLGIEGIDQIRRKEIDLIKQLSDGLSRNNSSQISVKDTFEIDVRGKENNNEIPWTMSFTTFGSRGTSFVARTLINIVLIDVFKKNLGSQQNFIIHCVMDEIGQLDTENRKGILDFATLRNIYLVQAAPETMNGSDYTYVYFIQNINDKCKFTQFVQN